ncbi:MAG: lytic murein transglycosylase [Alphaproteobacteria bacterium]|nr:lytic murein transglycosylase [Alphaproteobacteria bacterium]
MAIRFFLFLSLLLMLASQATAQNDRSYKRWFQETIVPRAQEQGISLRTLQSVDPLLFYDEQVIALDRRQPEKKITFEKYLLNTIPSSRVSQGRELMAEHKETLRLVSEMTGVPASMIVALWGIESSFGQNMGSYDVINALATLAYEGRRAEFFQNELIEALKILQYENRDPYAMQGSWAGAMGQCQFMPSSYRRYAVDFDGDGKRDIWESVPDVLASIAYYLQSEGWVRGRPWGREVMVTRPLDEALAGLDSGKALEEWANLGVMTMQRQPLPLESERAWLVQPDGPSGRRFLVYDNYKVLMRWNRSTYFATAVGLLADQL